MQSTHQHTTHTKHTPTHHAHTLTTYTPHRELKGDQRVPAVILLLIFFDIFFYRELKGIKEYLLSDRRVPLTEKELGKGSTEYKYIAPLSSAALAEVDTANTKPEL